MGFCNLKSKTGYAFYLLIYTLFIFRRMLEIWIIVSRKGTWGLEVKRGSRGEGVIYELSLVCCSDFYLLNVLKKCKIKT